MNVIWSVFRSLWRDAKLSAQTVHYLNRRHAERRSLALPGSAGIAGFKPWLLALILAGLCLLQLGCTDTGRDLKVIGTTPPAGEQGVVTNTFIEIAFNEAMDHASVERNLEIFPDIRLNTPPVWIDNSIIRLVPVNPLGTRVRYTIILHKGAKSLGGQTFDTDQNWQFTTIEPPFIKESSPENGANNISPDSEMRLVFNRPMNEASVLSASNIVALGLAPEWEDNSQVLVLKPHSDTPRLKYTYNLTISEDARDSMGNALGKQYLLSFTTGPLPLAIANTGATPTPTPSPVAPSIATPNSLPTPAAAIVGTYQLGTAGSNGINPESVAYNPKTQYLYVANSLSSNVMAIDATSNQPKIAIEVGEQPSGIAIDSERNLIYVANFNSNTISVISGSTNSLILSFSLNWKPDKLALLNLPGPDGKVTRPYLYVTHPQEGLVSVINLSNNTVEQVLSVRQRPRDLAVDEKAQRVYVANGESNLIRIIDARTNKLEDLTLLTHGWAEAVAVDPTLGRVYVANLDGTLDIFDQSNARPLLTGIFIGRNPRDIAVDAEHHLVYVVGEEQGLVVLNGTTGDHQATIKSDRGIPNSIALAPAINRLYLTHPTTNDITVLDLPSINRVDTIPLSTMLAGAAVNSTHNILYVADSENNQIYKISDGGITRVRIPLKNNSELSQIAVDEESGRVYIAGGNEVEMLDGQTLTPLTPNPLMLSDTVHSMVIQGPQLYISLSGANAIVRVDKLRNEVLNIWSVAPEPGAIAVDGRDNLIYIVHGTTGMISVLNATSGAVVHGPTKIGENLRDITIADDRIYVTSFNENVVYPLDKNLSLLGQRIPVGMGPSSITFLPGAHLLFVACTQFNQISVINTQSNIILPSLSLPAGSQPGVVVADRTANRVYIINSKSSTVNIIQASLPRPTTPEPTRTPPVTPGVTPAPASSPAGNPTGGH